MNSLVEFWKEFDFSHAPFVHPCDFEIIRSLRPNKITLLKDHKTFVHSSPFGMRDATLHLGLYPVPFQGNLRAADIFVVLLNPGLGLSDYQTQADRNHSRDLERVIKQDVARMQYPFFSLNPDYSRTGGFIWWEKKLREVLREIAKDHFAGSYVEALKQLSQRLAVIELFPYHSKSFGMTPLLKRLPSTRMAIEFVKSIAPRASRGEIKLIVTRKMSLFDGIDPKLVHFQPSLVRSAPLGPKTPGGSAILEQFRKQKPVW